MASMESLVGYLCSTVHQNCSHYILCFSPRSYNSESELLTALCILGRPQPFGLVRYMYHHSSRLVMFGYHSREVIPLPKKWKYKKKERKKGKYQCCQSPIIKATFSFSPIFVQVHRPRSVSVQSSPQHRWQKLPHIMDRSVGGRMSQVLRCVVDVCWCSGKPEFQAGLQLELQQQVYQH